MLKNPQRSGIQSQKTIRKVKKQAEICRKSAFLGVHIAEEVENWSKKAAETVHYAVNATSHEKYHDFVVDDYQEVFLMIPQMSIK